MTITQALSLDVARESVVRISAKQFDSNSRYLLITVLESGQEQAIPSASTITLNGRRPDGSSQSFLGSVQDGKAYLKIDDYLLEQYGTVYCSVSIIGSDGAKLSTLSFRMVVERAESTGWVLMYTAPSALSAGTYHINVGSISYQFTLTQALPVGGCIYFASDYTGAKTVVNGADVETLTLTVGTSGTELIGSDVVNFLTQISAEVSSINAGLDSKADKSAIEENLAAGTSLATIDKNSYTPHTTPYLHRISPSGKRCEYDVIGGTVGWNQLVQNGDFANGTTRWTINSNWTSQVNDGILHLTSVPNQPPYTNILQPLPTIAIVNHKYILNIEVMPSKDTSFDAAIGSTYGGGSFRGDESLVANQWKRLVLMGSPVTHTDDTLYIRPKNTTDAEAVDIYIKNIYLIDLTTLLGSTIADYAYTLEQATAGSGIAWLRSFGFLTKDYYPYCEPTLKSVEATARAARGINQWDEDIELGTISSSNGQNVSSTNGQFWRSKNYIPVISGEGYYTKQADGYTTSNANITFYYYDGDKNFIDYSNNRANGTTTIPNNVSYIRFTQFFVTPNLNTPKNICINLSNPTINGQYFPYESHTYPLGNVTLRGIPKLDSSNNIYYDGDKYKADGSVNRRYLWVDLGTLNWTKGTGANGYFYAELAGMKQQTGAAQMFNGRTSQYLPTLSRTNADWNSTTSEDKVIGTRHTTSYVCIVDSAYASSTASAFKAAMSGVYLLAEAATPTTETTSPFTPIQYTGSTEEFSTENDVPVGVDAKYYTDLTLPTLPTANGTYTLKCTVTDGTGIVSWVSE